MRTLRTTFTVLLVLASAALRPAGAAADEPVLDYHRASNFLPQTPSVTGGAVGAFFNPAAWSTNARTELAFWFDTQDLRPGQLDNWGLSVGRNLGFSVQTHTFPTSPTGTGRVQDYQIGYSRGNRRNHFGISWNWSGGDRDYLGRENGLSLGMVNRPDRHVTWGLCGFFGNLVNARQGILDLGLRPFGSPVLTVYGDYALYDGQKWYDGKWGAGFEVRPTDGVHLGMTFRTEPDDDELGVRFNIGATLDALGIHAQPGYDRDGDHDHTAWLYRIHPPQKGLPLARAVRSRGAPDRVVPVNLENRRLTYQTPRLFEKREVAWLRLHETLTAIGNEPSVEGVALNLAGMSARPSLVWELRRTLERMRARGKKVYIHADRLTMGTYYLASVADHLSLDPYGHLMLPGLALHRTYLKGMFDKLGIGVEEWRYFDYKTAAQGYVRKDMSEPDREQLQRLVDVLYETWREGICAGRGLETDRFDAAVDESGVIFAAEAVERGLVDTAGRWADLTSTLRKERGLKVGGLPATAKPRVHYDQVWGRPPEIAVVYAVGECSMDTGIRGRATSAHLRKLSREKNVAAVVLRADSPGGDPLPSDLVAEGVLRNRDAGKPVIVSQGDVAASGGYWISMDGSRILTTPVTITGSIGVIAGWFWDQGFGAKTGLTADGVQRGRHADLFAALRLPLLGLRLPERGITDEERERVETIIMHLYDDFVARVAAGRGLSPEAVREIAQGRVWMGSDARERGLVDGMGTLPDAIAQAKEMAGLGPQDEVILREYPPRKLFRLPELWPAMPRLFSSRAPEEPTAEDAEEAYELRYLRRLAAAPGVPFLFVPPESLPEGWGTKP